MQADLDVRFVAEPVHNMPLLRALPPTGRTRTPAALGCVPPCSQPTKLLLLCFCSTHPSADPCCVLDNPRNNARRRGNLQEQLAQMVLGRPGEAGAAAGCNSTVEQACAQMQQGQGVDGRVQLPQDTGGGQAALGATACGEGSELRVTRGLVKRWQVRRVCLLASLSLCGMLE